MLFCIFCMFPLIVCKKFESDARQLCLHIVFDCIITYEKHHKISQSSNWIWLQFATRNTSSTHLELYANNCYDMNRSNQSKEDNFHLLVIMKSGFTETLTQGSHCLLRDICSSTFPSIFLSILIKFKVIELQPLGYSVEWAVMNDIPICSHYCYDCQRQNEIIIQY